MNNRIWHQRCVCVDYLCQYGFVSATNEHNYKHCKHSGLPACFIWETTKLYFSGIQLSLSLGKLTVDSYQHSVTSALHESEILNFIEFLIWIENFVIYRLKNVVSR